MLSVHVGSGKLEHSPRLLHLLNWLFAWIFKLSPVVLNSLQLGFLLCKNAHDLQTVAQIRCSSWQTICLFCVWQVTAAGALASSCSAPARAWPGRNSSSYHMGSPQVKLFIPREKNWNQVMHMSVHWQPDAAWLTTSGLLLRANDFCHTVVDDHGPHLEAGALQWVCL